MNLPKLTTKQQEILKLLYRYRFLNRIQIQVLMGHKDYKTINLWLKDLREKEYVTWIYSTHFAEKTKPAIYYLGLNGIRHLKQLTTTDNDGNEQPTHPLEELRKRYRESTRSQTYIDRCVLLADCCITLRQHQTATTGYFYQTEADYLSENSYYHFVLDSELMRPHLIFCKDKYDKQGKEEATLESYLLEIFDATLPILLFVCPRTSDLIYAKRRTRGLLADAWEYKDDDEERPRIRFTTADKLKQSNVLAKEIWEQA